MKTKKQQKNKTKEVYNYGYHCPVCGARAMTYEREQGDYEIYTCDACGYQQTYKVR